jgi:hypothetical protein
MGAWKKTVWDGMRRVTPRAIRPTGYVTNLAWNRTEGKVYSGPFHGMKYIRDSYFGCYISKLLGIYERELHRAIDAAIAQKPDLVVDVGAADGYYAVGLSRRLPNARHIAFEMGEEGRELIEELAKLNECKVEVRGECNPQTLEEALGASDHALAIIDVEGYEKTLADPEKVPSLRKATMLIELHPGRAPGIAELLQERFGKTHKIERIWSEARDPAEYPFDSVIMRVLPVRHRLWALDEMRGVKMSWLWMERV